MIDSISGGVFLWEYSSGPSQSGVLPLLNVTLSTLSGPLLISILASVMLNHVTVDHSTFVAAAAAGRWVHKPKWLPQAFSTQPPFSPFPIPSTGLDVLLGLLTTGLAHLSGSTTVYTRRGGLLREITPRLPS